MAFDAATLFEVPKYIHYDARDLALLFDELFSEDAYQIYARMTADLEDIYKIEVGVATVRHDLCRLRNFLVEHQERIDVISDILAVDVPTLRRVIASAQTMKRDRKGVGRGMREQCRLLVRGGMTESSALVAEMRAWARKYGRTETTSEGSIAATVSTVRREFGLTNPNYYRARRAKRSKLRIAA